MHQPANMNTVINQAEKSIMIVVGIIGVVANIVGKMIRIREKAGIIMSVDGAIVSRGRWV